MPNRDVASRVLTTAPGSQKSPKRTARFRRGADALLLVVLTVAFISSSLQAGPSFSEESLEGSYKFAFEGKSASGGAFGGTGVLTFDGKGTLAGSQTLVSSGAHTHATLSGTYTVEPDGKGTITNTITYERLTGVAPGGWAPPPQPNRQLVHLTFKIDPATGDIDFVQADPDTDVTGRMRRLITAGRFVDRP